MDDADTVEGGEHFSPEECVTRRRQRRRRLATRNVGLQKAMANSVVYAQFAAETWSRRVLVATAKRVRELDAALLASGLPTTAMLPTAHAGSSTKDERALLGEFLALRISTPHSLADTVECARRLVQIVHEGNILRCQRLGALDAALVAAGLPPHAELPKPLADTQTIVPMLHPELGRLLTDEMIVIFVDFATAHVRRQHRLDVLNAALAARGLPSFGTLPQQYVCRQKMVKERDPNLVANLTDAVVETFVAATALFMGRLAALEREMVARKLNPPSHLRGRGQHLAMKALMVPGDSPVDMDTLIPRLQPLLLNRPLPLPRRNSSGMCWGCGLSNSSHCRHDLCFYCCDADGDVCSGHVCW